MAKLQTLRDKIKDEKERSCHNEADAFVCVVMSHGDHNGILLTSDCKDFDTKTDLVGALDGTHWRVMVGKPKIFLFQMCRGGRYNFVFNLIAFNAYIFSWVHVFSLVSGTTC